MRLNKYFFVMVSVLISIFGLVIISYFIPNSLLGKIIAHINTLSSVLIMTLTIFYVLTTIFQLNAMTNQINLMKDSTNMQIQPIPIPIIESMKLEKIRPFIGPEDKFMKMKVLSRFFCDFQFKNVGNGTALNVIIFPTIVIKDIKIPSPSLQPKLTYCISDEILQQNKIHIMMFDTGTEIAKAIANCEAKLELSIFYKNIFNIGFHEIISYDLFLKEGAEKWNEYFTKDQGELSKRVEKHNAIKPIDEKDAKEIFQKVKNDLENIFPDDLNVRYQIEPKSFTINIVDYIESVRKMEIENEQNFKKIFKESYDFFKKIRKYDYCA